MGNQLSILLAISSAFARFFHISYTFLLHTLNYSLHSKVHDCYTYTIKKYPVEFLTDYTFLREYENSIEKPYLET